MDYKNLPETACVYRITLNEKSYIGSTLNLKDRTRRHLYQLNKQEHSNNKLQNAYNKYKDFLEIAIIKELPSDINLEVLKAYETIYHYEFNSIEKGLNLDYPRLIKGKFNLDSNSINKRIKSSSIKVVMINRFTGKYVKEFNSISEAAKEIEESTSNISQVCKGKLNYVKDYIFVYSTDYNPDKNYKYDHHWCKDKKFSEEHKRKLAKSNTRNKKIYKYDLNYNLVEEYYSRSEAERQNNFKREFLRYKLKHKTPINGYIYTDTKY